jgi:hypothetical protein
MKRLQSVENDRVQLEIIECSCGFHLGIDATWLDQCLEAEGFSMPCPNCGAFIPVDLITDEDTMFTEESPTYKATHAIKIEGEQLAKAYADLLIEVSAFFVVEPFPDDEWRFFFKEEYIKTAERLAAEAEAVKDESILN